MSAGPGKYGAISEMVAGMTDARMAVVLIVGGSRGNGFAVSTMDAELERDLPKLLRIMADEIEGTRQEILALKPQGAG